MKIVEDDFYLCLSDITRVLKEKWRWIRLAAVLLGVLLTLLALFKPPIFVSKAVFQDKGKNSIMPGSGSGSVMSMSIVALGGGANNQALAIMGSKRLGERVIGEFGLQISEIPPGKSLRLLFNIKDNLLSEFATWLDKPSSVTQARMSSVVFQKVSYEGLYPVAFSLEKLQNGHVIVRDKSGQIIAESVKGQPVEFEGIRFTPIFLKKELAGKRIAFVIQPLYKVLAAFHSGLDVSMGKRKDGTINISYQSQSPRMSTLVANGLIGEYLRIVRGESAQTIQNQMEFLGDAQSSALEEMDMRFQEYAHAAEDNIVKSGFLRTKEGIKMYQASYSALKSQIQGLEQEISLLERPDPALIASSHPSLSGLLSELNRKLHDLNTKKNALEIVLAETAPGNKVPAIGETLKKISQEKILCQKLNDLKKGTLPTLSVGELQETLTGWAGEVRDCPDQREKFESYVDSLIAASHLRSRLLNKLVGCESSPSELKGLGLGQATNRYNTALEELQGLDIKETNLNQACHQLANGDFRIGALIDTVGVGKNFAGLIEECNGLANELKDSKNYSTKEIGRMEQALALKKSMLKDHLSEVAQVNSAQQVKLKERIRGIQSVLLGLVREESALIEEEMRRAIVSRKEEATRELETAHTSIEALRKQMSTLPKRWSAERKLDMQTEIQSELMKGLVGLVESRQLAGALDIIESRPLDHAELPIRPKSPGLVMWAVIGTILGALFSSMAFVGREALRGFRASVDNLTVRGQYVAGWLKGRGAKEKTLSNALHFTDQEGPLFVVGKRSVNEIMDYQDLLSKRGEKVCIVTEDNAAKSQADLHVIKHFNIRGLQEAFKELGSQYDKILVHVNRESLDIEVATLLKEAASSIVYLKEERVKDLSFYFALSEKCPVAFIFSQ